MALLTVVSDGARVGRVAVRRQRGVGLHLLLVHHGSVRLQALLSFSCSSCNRMFQLGSVGVKRGPAHKMASASVVNCFGFYDERGWSDKSKRCTGRNGLTFIKCLVLIHSFICL